MGERKSKKSMRNSKRDEAKRLREYEDKKLRVKAAIEAGFIQRRELAKAAEIALHELNNMFTKDRVLYAEYCVRRKTITDIAADNIYDVVNDKTHPKNYDASKFVVQNFKTEFDDVLESKDNDGMGVNITGDNDGGGIVIKFGKSGENE